MIKSIKNIPIGGHLGGGEWSLNKLQKITVLMGKNGAGKSTLLDTLSIHFRKLNIDDERLEFDVPCSGFSAVKVEKIVPERGGFYEVDGNLLSSSYNDENFLSDQSRGNNQINYRKIVASKLLSFLSSFGFMEEPSTETAHEMVGVIIKNLNMLLPSKYEVERKLQGNKLVIKDRSNGEEISQNSLSSGEREVFSLAIDILVSVFKAKSEGVYLILLLDEPDVHLHPDLQSKLYDMLDKVVNEYSNVQLIIGTHSSVFMIPKKTTGLVWLQEGIKELRVEKIPVWANPLLLTASKGLMSPILGKVKTLLVEGADDYQIWHQAVKSSGGKLKAVPFDCGSKSEMNAYIKLLNKLLSTLTDRVLEEDLIIALRDNDGENVRNQRITNVKRYSTVCHEIENCILSDEICSQEQRDRLNITEPLLVDIKSRMQDVVNIVLPEGDWQRKIGSVIGQLYHADNIEEASENENSIVNYLGKDFINSLKSD